ncbi:MAG: AAA family ATPase [Gammaproteobacteria bacterium]|nr:AAA family ATPase [Gammaproteobacteria bacterium]
MYEKYFGFREKPFSLIPDPSFLYLGKKHSLALTMLEYALVNEAAMVVVTGEIGSGKTTIVRHILGKYSNDAVVGLIANTHKAFGDLMQWVSMAFGLVHEGKDKVTLYHNFVNFLIGEYARGKRTILIVDEAQNMDVDTLEELRVLSNINADKNLVLQLVLVGQPGLRATLRKPELEQFAQRILVDYHLDALDVRETRAYILHRLLVAGGRPEIFSREAADLIHELSGGIPRLINSLCDQSLVYAYADQRAKVTTRVVKELVADKKSRSLFGAGKINYVAVGETAPVDYLKPN